MTKKADTTNEKTAASEQTAAGDSTPDEHVFKIEDIIGLISDAMSYFNENFPETVRPGEQRRLIGAGLRNYAFSDKVSDTAVTNPKFAPSVFSQKRLYGYLRDIEDKRAVLLEAQTLVRTVSQSLLMSGDDAFREALLYYNSVRELSRQGVPGARAVFNMLQSRFKRRRSTTSTDEPTQKELERDIHALLHGTKDGEIVIKNERPVVSKGKRMVIDSTHKDKAAFKETEEGQL
jgi:hypothetical protein